MYILHANIAVQRTDVTFTVPLLFIDVNIYTPLSTPDRVKKSTIFSSNKQHAENPCMSVVAVK